MLRGGEKEREGVSNRRHVKEGGRSMEWVDSRVKVRERLRELAVGAKSQNLCFLMGLNMISHRNLAHLSISQWRIFPPILTEMFL